jgi:apolipoprotein N-acyltransferase
VPFGEYLPFQHALEAIGLQQLVRMRGGFDSGATPRPLLRVPRLPPLGTADLL